jgi:chaperonin GroEL (HSP60 family)
MNKMVINHLDKLFVTNDAATIVNELEVQHPAAKLLVLASRAQQEEIGDGANLVVSFAGELLEKAEELIRMGLHPSEIIMGYNKAINKVSSHFQSDGSGIVKSLQSERRLFSFVFICRLLRFWRILWRKAQKTWMCGTRRRLC